METSWLTFRIFHRFLPFLGLKFMLKDMPHFICKLLLQLTNSNFHSESVHSTMRTTMRMCDFLLPGTIIDLLRFILSFFLLNTRIFKQSLMNSKVRTFLAIKCLILSAFSGSAVSKSTLSWCKLSFSWPEKSAAKFLFASPPGPSPYQGSTDRNVVPTRRNGRRKGLCQTLWIPCLIQQLLGAFQQIDEHSSCPFELFLVDF